MKKWIAAACMLTMTASLLTACGQSGSGAEEAAQPDDMVQTEGETEAGSEAEAAGAKEAAGGRTTFTVGFDAEFPPYGYKDDSGDRKSVV